MIRRTLLALATVTVAAFTAPALATSPVPDSGGVLPAAARALLQGRCLTPAPTTARGWQGLFDDLNDDGWSGADQGSSLRLPDGRLLWLFADTFQGAEQPDGSRAPGTRMVHNSLVLADGGCLTPVNGPTGAEIIPNSADGLFYWPMHAILDGSRLLVTVTGVRRTSPDPTVNGFAQEGTWIAEFTVTPGGTPQFQRLRPTPSSHVPDDQVHWGTALAQDSGWTYVYGTRTDPAPQTYGKALYVARVPVGRLLDLTAWTYWDGRQWSTQARDARAIRPAHGGVSSSLSVWKDPASGQWQAVTKKDEFLGSEIVRLTAASPTGPWIEQVIGRSPSYAQPGVTTYTALGHPEIPLADGSVLVSVSRNSDRWQALMADADLYKPQFLSAP